MPSSSTQTFLELVVNTELECTEADASHWFADEHDEDEPGGRSEQAIAMAICKRCPIKYSCFQYAIENDIQHGVWGHSTPGMRTAYRKRMGEGWSWRTHQ